VTPSQTRGWIGASIDRHEDDRLLRGIEPFVADVQLPGQLAAAIVRSPVAHGVLRAIDAAAARARPGVLAVFTAEDVVGDLGSVPVIHPRLSVDELLVPYLQPVVAHDRVRFAGEPIAIVIAEDRYAAEDGAELVIAEIEPIAPVLDPLSADEGPALFPGLPNRIELSTSYGDAAAALKGADVVVSARIGIGRHTGVAMETRGLVAAWDEAAGEMTLYGSTKVPHFKRGQLAGQLGLEEDAVRIVSLSAGGGFGVKGEVYPEDFLIPWAAKQLGRPVSWIEDRHENLIAANHSRDQQHEATIAADADGHIVALVTRFVLDAGAYVRTVGVRVAELTMGGIPGPYDIPSYAATGSYALTNKTPTGTYRSPGGFEATFVCDRMIDLLAERIGRDPIELRRENLIRPEQMPYTRPLESVGDEIVLEAGDYPEMLDRVLAEAGREQVRRRRGAGERVGLGVGAYLEKTGIGPWESASVCVSAEPPIVVRTGATSLGQGIRTVLAQIVAEELGVPSSGVAVETGDTHRLATGRGTYASRSTVMAGNAARLAALAAIEAGRPFAATALGTQPEALVFRDGSFESDGTSGAVSLQQAAALAARENGTGLLGSEVFETGRANFSHGVVAAIASVDPELGAVHVERLVLGYDVGRAVNPRLVEGQLHGAAVQAIGGALLEEFVYDTDGNPIATTFFDYLLPGLGDAPELTVLLDEVPSTSNPLGVKGAGEAGICGVAAAIAAAIEDALDLPGTITATPATPEVVWRAAAAARRARA
jgi:carbon-monoxide dehydrogenase large subunit/6-hydroxypseudooxynicotine dehydrogenase subunit gamma